MAMLIVVVLLFAQYFIAICAIIFFVSLMAYKKRIGVRTSFNSRVLKNSVIEKKDEASKELDETSKQSDTPGEETETEKLHDAEPASETMEAEDGFTPITVADDEYYEPPKAKSSIKYEEEPADNADVIQDIGEASYYESLAKQQEQLENI